MQETKRPHMFTWGQAGHSQRAVMPKTHDQRIMPIDIRIDQSLPAFTKCSLDGNPGNGDPNDGDKEGAVNYYLYWETKDIVDEAVAWETTVGLIDKAPKDGCTVDLTPRRLQKFEVKAGEDLAAVLQALPRCTSSRGSLGRTATPRASTAGSAMSSWRWRSSRAFGMPADCLRR